MPKMQTALAGLNHAFAPGQIEALAKRREMFAPGAPFNSAAADLGAEPGSAMHRKLAAYIAKLPPGLSEALRATIYQALGTSPPTQVTFAWAPHYDYELGLWQAPDAEDTRGGITVLIKSRYPDDRHPLESS